MFRRLGYKRCNRIFGMQACIVTREIRFALIDGGFFFVFLNYTPHWPCSKLNLVNQDADPALASAMNLVKGL